MLSKKVVGFLAVSMVLVSALSIRAGDYENEACPDQNCVETAHSRHNRNTPVGLVGVIPIPGNPLVSTDLLYADSGTQRVYVADRSNNAVDIIDAVNNFYVGRVSGLVGVTTQSGGTTATNDSGPNGVLVTPNKKLWIGDGNSTAVVADVDPDSPTYLTILKSISTNIPACDDGTNHYCARADELGYDPLDHIILIMNDRPRSTAAPHNLLTPYGTFIDSTTYKVLGQVSLPNAGGAEQPVWDAELGKFFVTVPGTATVQPGEIALINPITMKLEVYYGLGDVSCTSANGLTLAPFQILLASGCGNPMIVDALTGNVLKTITQVGGGDEVWYNPGDGRFYVTGADNRNGKPRALGVIDAQTHNWLQNVDFNASSSNPTAFEGNNHIFTTARVTANQAGQATPAAVDDTVCASFGYKGTGCIAVFSHATPSVGAAQ
jgi:hypothetical protein